MLLVTHHAHRVIFKRDSTRVHQPSRYDASVDMASLLWRMIYMQHWQAGILDEKRGGGEVLGCGGGDPDGMENKRNNLHVAENDLFLREYDELSA